MHPTLLKLGPVTLHTYGLFLAIAFLAALFLIQRDAKRAGLNPQAITDMAFWTLLAAIFASRVRHILMFPDMYAWNDPLGWIAIWRGGLVFDGGLVGAILFCYVYMRWRGMDIWKTADVVLPYLPMAHAIGRLGCFFGFGCCYGKATDLPWGVCFPRIPADPSQVATGSPVYLDQFGSHGHELWSLPVHPTQLYEAVGLLAIFGMLLLMRKKWHPYKGFTLAVYMVSYGTLRFLVEFLRGDHNPTRIAGLSDQQVFSLLLAGIGLILFFTMRRRPALRTA